MNNIVEAIKSEISELATKKGLGIRFTQTNHSNFACTSRVYLYTGESVVNCNSENVVECWDFNQPQDRGTTVRCERYRVYSDVLEYLTK